MGAPDSEAKGGDGFQNLVLLGFIHGRASTGQAKP